MNTLKKLTLILSILLVSLFTVYAGSNTDNIPAHFTLKNNTGYKVYFESGFYDNPFYYNSLQYIEIPNKETKEIFLKDNLSGFDNFPIIKASRDSENSLYTWSFNTTQNKVGLLDRMLEAGYAYSCADNNCTNPTSITLCTSAYLTEHNSCD
jgi:hypothetical protein